jgi:hypothetical protein
VKLAQDPATSATVSSEAISETNGGRLDNRRPSSEIKLSPWNDAGVGVGLRMVKNEKAE